MDGAWTRTARKEPALARCSVRLVGEGVLQAGIAAHLVPTLTQSFFITAAVIFVAFLLQVTVFVEIHPLGVAPELPLLVAIHAGREGGPDRGSGLGPAGEGVGEVDQRHVPVDEDGLARAGGSVLVHVHHPEQ